MKAWEGIGKVESRTSSRFGHKLNLSLTEECDTVELTHGILKPGKQYRVEVEEKDTTDWCDCDDPDCPNFRPIGD